MSPGFGSSGLINPIVYHTDIGGGITSFQVNFPWTVPDPLSPTRDLITFFTFLGGPLGQGICRSTAVIDNPNQLALEGPVTNLHQYIDTMFTPDETPDGKFWCYASNSAGTVIDLLTSTDNGNTWVVDPSSPVLSYTAFGGGVTGISSLSVIKNSPTDWWGYVNYRHPVDDLKGVKLVHSNNGKVWAVQNGGADVLHIQPNTYWSRYFESQWAGTIGNTYVMACSNNEVTPFNPWGYWTINWFYSFTPDFASYGTIPALQFNQIAAGWQISTPYYTKIKGRWWGQFQRAINIGNYGLQNWDLVSYPVDNLETFVPQP